MIRTLPALFALLFAAPLMAAPEGQQTLFNFVRPADVVKVATQDASLPQYNAEQTAEGEVLRRITFNPAAEPSLVLSPNNTSKKVADLYYVGAGTNPGIGMPVTLISAELLYKRIIGDKTSGPLKHI